MQPSAPDYPPHCVKVHLGVAFLRRCAIVPVRVLLIGKDDRLAKKATFALDKAGYSVERAYTPLNGMKKLYEGLPDLIIMIKDLQNASQEDPCVQVKRASYLPMIVLGEQCEGVETLESGIDVYMSLPVNIRLLIARVKALLRSKEKSRGVKKNQTSSAENILNMETHSSSLTPTEHRLVSCLALNTGKTVDYDRLLREVWGGKDISKGNLQFYAHRVQQKLRGFSSCLIVNCHGVGYRLEAG